MNIKLNNIIESKSDYEMFLKTNEGPVVLVIEASWSGNCQIMEPIIEKLSNEFNDRIRFIAVKNELSKLFEMNFDSDVLPKLLLFNKDQIIDQVFGTASLRLLEEKMKALLQVSSTNNIST
ncbi:MAG: thioredoxin family protein [Ignavibacteria bacterium]|nr:thioredoxin family protein [Ignavibacteria bacterium]